MDLKKSAKGALVKLANARSYELIPSWEFDKQPLVRHLKAVFKLYGVDCVFDVGGNMGQYHDLLRDDVGFQGWIISFEPVRKYINMLESKAEADSKWRVCPYALGGSESESSINVTKSPGLNSFLSPSKEGIQGFWSDDAITSIETVKIRALDQVFGDFKNEYGFKNPYLKLDTQGFDLEALKGANLSLTNFKALQTEGSVKPLYREMPDYQTVLSHLIARGFELSGMFPVTLDDQLRLIEFDCVMVACT